MKGRERGQQLLDDAGIMGILQLVDPLGKGIRRIIGQDGASGLEENLALVIMRIDIVNRDARLRLASGQHRLMHMMAIHAFAAKLRQQRRMDIDDPIGESIQ